MFKINTIEEIDSENQIVLITVTKDNDTESVSIRVNKKEGIKTTLEKLNAEFNKKQNISDLDIFKLKLENNLNEELK